MQKENKTRKVKNGFSWTVLFFGFLVPLFKLDWGYLILLLIIDGLTAMPLLIDITQFSGFIHEYFYGVIAAYEYLHSVFGVFTPYLGYAAFIILTVLIAGTYNWHLYRRYKKRGYVVVNSTKTAPEVVAAAPVAPVAAAKVVPPVVENHVPGSEDLIPGWSKIRKVDMTKGIPAQGKSYVPSYV